MSKKIGWALLLFITYIASDRFLAPAAIAQHPTPTPTPKPIQFNPPNNGTPGGKRAGTPINTGSRPDCPNVGKNIAALIPKTNWGNTLNEHPTLWFYIPYQQGNLTLIIKDQNTANTIAIANYKITNGGGIAGFKIPDSAPGLEVNRAYFWRVYLSCKPNVKPSLIGVEGVVARVDLDKETTAKLNATTAMRERLEIYTERGLWYEAIALLIQSLPLQKNNPEFKQYWSELLSNPHVDLKDFISEPLVKCCNYTPR